MTELQPRFGESDCPKCRFIAHVGGYDVYRCPRLDADNGEWFWLVSHGYSQYFGPHSRHIEHYAQLKAMHMLLGPCQED